MGNPSKKHGVQSGKEPHLPGPVFELGALPAVSRRVAGLGRKLRPQTGLAAADWSVRRELDGMRQSYPNAACPKLLSTAEHADILSGHGTRKDEPRA
jgi:hypothetical protein